MIDHQLHFDTMGHRERRPSPASERELWLRAQALNGRTLGEIAQALHTDIGQDGRRTKGRFGQLIEAALGSDLDAGDQPDFAALGVELKTVPVDKNGKPVGSTYCCRVPHGSLDRMIWEQSRFRHKLKKILFVSLTQQPNWQDRIVSQIQMWQMTEIWQQRFQTDWEALIGALACGRIPNASEGHYIQLRPKGRNSQSRVLAQGEGDTLFMQPLGWYLRASTVHAMFSQQSEA